MILEPKLHYRTSKEDVPEGEHVVPLGEARIAREGSDVTLVAYGAMVPLAERAADALEDEASCEVLDLRSLKPLDEDALLASVGKTGRAVIVQEAPRVCGFAAEVAAVLAEKAIFDLRGPVLRVTGYDVPYPYWQIEDAYMPSVERVADAVRRVLAASRLARSRRGGPALPDRLRAPRDPLLGASRRTASQGRDRLEPRRAATVDAVGAGGAAGALGEGRAAPQVPGPFDLGTDFVMGIFDRDESGVLGGTGLHKRRGAHALEIGYWIRAAMSVVGSPRSRPRV